MFEIWVAFIYLQANLHPTNQSCTAWWRVRLWEPTANKWCIDSLHHREHFDGDHFHFPSLACDPTTVKDLRKITAKVFQPSFSGLPWTKGITEISYTLMGTAIGLSMHPMYIHLSTSIWTIKSCLNTQEIAHYSSLLIQNTPMKFQSNFIRNTHKIKLLRLQYIQMVIHNYCIIGNKRGLLLKSLCCWGWTSQVICLLTSLYSLSYLRMGPAAPIKRFPASEAPPALWHWTRSCHMHLTVSTSSEKKKLVDYPTLNSTCRWYCWHFCHQSIHQPIKFTSTRLHKRLHNNMVKVKTVPVPQPKTKQKTTRISAVMTLWVPITRYHQRKAREHGMSWKNIAIRTPLIH